MIPMRMMEVVLCSGTSDILPEVGVVVWRFGFFLSHEWLDKTVEVL